MSRHNAVLFFALSLVIRLVSSQCMQIDLQSGASGGLTGGSSYSCNQASLTASSASYTNGIFYYLRYLFDGSGVLSRPSSNPGSPWYYLAVADTSVLRLTFKSPADVDFVRLWSVDFSDRSATILMATHIAGRGVTVFPSSGYPLSVMGDPITAAHDFIVQGTIDWLEIRLDATAYWGACLNEIQVFALPSDTHAKLCHNPDSGGVVTTGAQGGGKAGKGTLSGTTSGSSTTSSDSDSDPTLADHLALAGVSLAFLLCLACCLFLGNGVLVGMSIHGRRRMNALAQEETERAARKGSVGIIPRGSLDLEAPPADFVAVEGRVRGLTATETNETEPPTPGDGSGQTSAGEVATAYGSGTVGAKGKGKQKTESTTAIKPKSDIIYSIQDELDDAEANHKFCCCIPVSRDYLTCAFLMNVITYLAVSAACLSGIAAVIALNEIAVYPLFPLLAIAIFVVMIYLLYACFCSTTARQFWNLSRHLDVREQIELRTKAAPSMYMTWETWHYETRVRTQTTYVNGRPVTSTYTETIRVSTGRGRVDYVISQWMDRSPALDLTKLWRFAACRILFVSDVLYWDDNTTEEIEKGRKRLKDSIKHKDKNYSISTTTEWNHINDNHVMAFFDLKEKPLVIGFVGQTLAIVCCSWWCYRVLINEMSAAAQVRIYKQIQVTGTKD